MKITIQYDRKTDGRIIAEIPALNGVIAFGNTKAEARAAVLSQAQIVINDRAERERARLEREQLASV